MSTLAWTPDPGNLQAITYPERSTVGQPNWQIGEYGQQAIGHRGPEGQVVRDLMDGQEQVLVRRCTNYICRREEFPGQHGRVTEQICAADLQ